jgi:hypothetical protein
MRDPERQAARQVGDDRKMEGCGLVAITDPAQENMEYVRTLLKKNQPEFAALLEWLERELQSLECLRESSRGGRRALPRSVRRDRPRTAAPEGDRLDISLA